LFCFVLFSIPGYKIESFISGGSLEGFVYGNSNCNLKYVVEKIPIRKYAKMPVLSTSCFLT